MKKLLDMGYMNILTKNITQNIADMYPIHRTEDDFDTDPYEINFQNGIFDIRRGMLLQHTPTKLTRHILNASYITNKKMEDGKKILTIRKEKVPHKIVMEALYDESLNDTENARIVKSVMEILASFLIGYNKYKLVYVIVGKPNTGKSTLLQIPCTIFGDYAGSFNNGVLLESPRSSNDIRPDIIALRGKRLMAGSETKKGNKFDMELIKRLAGNDPLPCRKPHQGKMVYCIMKGKFILVTNTCPNFSGVFSNEEPRSKLLGIFFGEEIYSTGEFHTPIQKSDTTFSVVVNFPEQAPGYGPRLPIKEKIRLEN
jgi:phage/plasmid-associated DNA primase